MKRNLLWMKVYERAIYNLIKGYNTNKAISRAMAPTSSRGGLSPYSVLTIAIGSHFALGDWPLLTPLPRPSEETSDATGHLRDTWGTTHLQGCIAHKKPHPPLGPPYGPGHSPTVSPYGKAVSYRQGTPVKPFPVNNCRSRAS